MYNVNSPSIPATLRIVSHLAALGPEDRSRGCALRAYPVDGRPTIGVHGDEDYEVVVEAHGKRLQVAISVDGTNVLTGKKAVWSDLKDTFVVEPHARCALAAWPETDRRGARFRFTSVPESVAANTHGDLGAVGYISVAVWEEGYRPPAYAIRSSYSYGGGLESFNASRGVALGPGTGAGSTIDQPIGRARGSSSPRTAASSRCGTCGGTTCSGCSASGAWCRSSPTTRPASPRRRSRTCARRRDLGRPSRSRRASTRGSSRLTSLSPRRRTWSQSPRSRSQHSPAFDA